MDISMKIQNCFICEQTILYTTINNSNSSNSDYFNCASSTNKRLLICQRFCKVASRYLNIDSESEYFKPGETIKLALPPDTYFSPTLSKQPSGTVHDHDDNLQNLNCCEACFSKVKQFCDSYHQWLQIKIMLDNTSREIAETIQIKRCPQPNDDVKSGKKFHNQELPDGRSCNLAQFKQNFVKLVEAKNNRNFPKIRLKPLLETEIPTPRGTDYGAIDIDYDDTVSVAEESDSNPITEAADTSNGNKTNSEGEIDPGKISGKDARPYRPENSHKGVKKPFKCSYCDSCFRKDHRRLEHETIHTKSNPFPCQFCGKSFKLKNLCKRHETNVHDPKKIARNEKKPFKCHICDHGFLSKDSRQRHMRAHAGEKNWACSFCGRKFFQNQSRLEHEMIHTKEFPYICGFCNKSFQRSLYCRNHQRQAHLEVIKIDDGQEDETAPQYNYDIRIKCQNCPKTFTKVSDLRSHMERHHKLKAPKRSPKGKRKISKKPRQNFQDSSSSSPSTPQIAYKLEYDYEIGDENGDENEMEADLGEVGQVEPKLEVSDIVIKSDNFGPILLH